MQVTAAHARAFPRQSVGLQIHVTRVDGAHQPPGPSCLIGVQLSTAAGAQPPHAERQVRPVLQGNVFEVELRSEQDTFRIVAMAGQHQAPLCGVAQPPELVGAPADAAFAPQPQQMRAQGQVCAPTAALGPRSKNVKSRPTLDCAGGGMAAGRAAAGTEALPGGTSRAERRRQPVATSSTSSAREWPKRRYGGMAEALGIGCGSSARADAKWWPQQWPTRTRCRYHGRDEFQPASSSQCARNHSGDV